MNKWLEIYRNGKWRNEIHPNTYRIGDPFTWQSAESGEQEGVIVLTDRDEWVVVAGHDEPHGLAWVNTQNRW